jgi:hypothetical protein
MLTSGERSSQDAGGAAGNRATSFVSAEGDELRTIDVGEPGVPLRVIVIVEAEQGQLQVDVLDADGSVALSAQSRPDEQVTRSGGISANDSGALSYRVSARGARGGGYQILYQRQ